MVSEQPKGWSQPYNESIPSLDQHRNLSSWNLLFESFEKAFLDWHHSLEGVAAAKWDDNNTTERKTHYIRYLKLCSCFQRKQKWKDVSTILNIYTFIKSFLEGNSLLLKKVDSCFFDMSANFGGTNLFKKLTFCEDTRPPFWTHSRPLSRLYC